ncbi:hypothetical protein Slin15195_G083070 [Septoria linicola]|uniref:Uncharacterized protein n=1 Tax=Septoria linicola TaxID=215465 RepID=A0A9Q9AZQ9_9PEZI|nr:hypothetical protein Slin14017_G085580 [Septoria linicola]USW54988.1 hypothetical protein Slin15195_G083070 [Septoria linicola]
MGGLIVACLTTGPGFEKPSDVVLHHRQGFDRFSIELQGVKCRCI